MLLLSLVLFMTISSSTAISGTEKLKKIDEVLIYCNTGEQIPDLQKDGVEKLITMGLIPKTS